jgi:hypothetical protein
MPVRAERPNPTRLPAKSPRRREEAAFITGRRLAAPDTAGAGRVRTADPSSIAALQRVAGNAAVAALLRDGEREARSPAIATAPRSALEAGVVQRITVSSAEDVIRMGGKPSLKGRFSGSTYGDLLSEVRKLEELDVQLAQIANDVGLSHKTVDFMLDRYLEATRSVLTLCGKWRENHAKEVAELRGRASGKASDKEDLDKKERRNGAIGYLILAVTNNLKELKGAISDLPTA